MNDRLSSRLPGLELVEIKPVILGGDPSDPKNKVLVTRQQHFEMVRYWNRVINDLRKAKDARRSL